MAYFQPATRGCSMAHCDGRMSDQAGMTPPMTDTARVLWKDEVPRGSAIGLGCASNGRVAACTYANPASEGDNLVVYDADGNRQWASGTLLDAMSWTSAPMIDESGGVIAADDRYVIRFDASGNVIWKTETPGGLPISPVVTANGVIVLATASGPLSAYDSADGHLIGYLYIKENPDDTEYFATLNTPCVKDNRVYVSTARTNDPENTAWLVAVDVDPENSSEPLQVKWHYTFGGSSGASPLRIDDVIYFDGDRVNPGDDVDPHLFAVRDDGDSGSLVWTRAMADSVKVSAAQDPRGGLWAFALLTPYLLRLDAQTGGELERLDIDALVYERGKHLPCSVMTIAGSADRPVMLTSASAFYTDGSSWLLAIDLESRSLLWKVLLAEHATADFTAAQFALVESDAQAPVVIFPTFFGGAQGVAD